MDLADDRFHSSRLAQIALPFCRKLESADDEERQWLLPMLHAFGPHSAAAVPALVTLLESSVWIWRKAAAGVLARIGARAMAASDPLQRLLASGEQQMDAAKALVHIGAVDSVPALRRWAAKADWLILNEWAQVPFHDCGREAWAAGPVLVELADAPEFHQHRQWFATWIGRICRDGDVACESLFRWLRDPDWGDAAECVGRSLRNALVVQSNPLREWLDAVESLRLRPECRIDDDPEGEGLGLGNAFGSEIIDKDEWAPSTPAVAKAVHSLAQVLKDGTFVERCTALEVLKSIGPAADGSTAAVVEAGERTVSRRVKRLACNALASIGSRADPVLPFLRTTMHCGHWRAEVAAICAIGDIGLNDAIEALFGGLFGNPTTGMRRHVLVTALCQCGRGAENRLAEMVESRLPGPLALEQFDDLCSLAAACSEYELDKSECAAIIAMRYDHHRFSAACCIAKDCARDPNMDYWESDEEISQYADFLFNVLRENPGRNGSKIVSGLGWLRDARAVPLLVDQWRTGDDSNCERSAALKALARPEFATPEVVEVFRIALESSDFDVAMPAANCFHKLGPAAKALLPLVRKRMESDPNLAIYVHWEEAIALLDPDEALAADPENIKALMNRARAAIDRRDMSAAIQDFSALVSVVPEDDYTVYLRGWCRFHLGELAAAEADYRRAVELNSHWLEHPYESASDE